MVMSPMVYNAQPSERLAWFTAIAGASDLPLMLYNNPPAYRNDITPEEAKSLAAIDTIVAIKESSGDTGVSSTCTAWSVIGSRCFAGSTTWCWSVWRSVRSGGSRGCPTCSRASADGCSRRG